MTIYSSLELCAGAGGQARGLELAGFGHAALVEIDHHAAATLRANRPKWRVIEDDLFTWAPPGDLKGVDLVAGGVPCPPFSHAGLQLGEADERNLFDRAIEIVEAVAPRAVMIENVRGLMDPKFEKYRSRLLGRLEANGYLGEWKLLQAADFNVPQLRPRSILVALRAEDAHSFEWPEPMPRTRTVGDTLIDLMEANGWEGAQDWANGAQHIAPTLVGGSKKHGGPDLGPTRARRAWETLGVDGRGLADEAPLPGFSGSPRLTVRMAARLQGFDDSWVFSGRKTASYRQVGNAFPPPVARAVGVAIRRAFEVADSGNDIANTSDFGSRAQQALAVPIGA